MGTTIRDRSTQNLHTARGALSGPCPYSERVTPAETLAPSARTILVIEDEARTGGGGAARPHPGVGDQSAIAVAVAARLRSEGYLVDIASDGPGGVAKCQELQPDLVVLDLMLPGFDGLEVCERIQQDRAVPVLMLTARGSESDLVVGLGAGADDYMTKPFSTREL